MCSWKSFIVSRWVRFPHGKARIGQTETAILCVLRQVRILSTLPEEVKCCRIGLGFRRRRRAPFFQAHVRLCNALPKVLRDRSTGRATARFMPETASGQRPSPKSACHMPKCGFAYSRFVSITEWHSSRPRFPAFRDAVFHFMRIEIACRTMLPPGPETYSDKT